MPEGQGYALAASGGEDGVVVVRSAQWTSAGPLYRDVRSSNGGRTWEAFTVSANRTTSFHPSPTGSGVWYAVSGRTLYRSVDGTATWSVRSRGNFEHPDEGLYYVEVGAEPDLLFAKHVVDACNSIDGSCRSDVRGEGMVSTDGGETWRSLGIHEVLDGLHPSPADARVVYAKRRVGPEARLFRSEDQGATWTLASPALESEGAKNRFFSSQVVLDRRDPRILYVVYDPRYTGRDFWALHATRDGGRTWTLHEPRHAIGTFVADPLQAGRAWLFGPEGRVHESRDAGETWVAVEADPRTATAFLGAPAAVFRRDGGRVALRLLPDELWRMELGDGALALGSDLWWNPAEPGTGLTITHHPSRQAFVVWYAFDAAGDPVWRVIPGGTWSDRTFSGTLYETSGSDWFGVDFDSRVDVRRVGEAQLDFADESNATLSWRFDAGAEGEQAITRQLFGPAAVPNTAESYADLWWNASEPGWGIAISHQYNTVFAAWFVYGDGGEPRWVVMPDARVSFAFVGVQTRPVATGDIYAASAGASATSTQVTKVGTATIAFTTRDRAVLDYEAFGKQGRKAVTRQPF